MQSQIKNLNFSIPQWILVSIRVFFLSWALGVNYLFHNILPYLSSFIPFIIWKRYISCIVNLILTRIIFLILGFFSFECQNFGFFSRESQKITVKSGFIALCTHKNIIDFFYYSYMFNPLFVKLILIVKTQNKEGKQEQVIKQVYYSPLTYSQALECSFKNRGFDPIVIRDEKQFKKIKSRKMNMKTLVSQSFQEMKGCIFILLPGLKINEHIQIEQIIAEDVFDNEVKFLRSGVGLRAQFDKRNIYQKQFKNQIYFLLSLMSEFRKNHLNVVGLAFRKDFRYQYRRDTYRDWIQQNFFIQQKLDIKHKKISYIEYLKKEGQYQKQQEKHEKHEKHEKQQLVLQQQSKKLS